MDTWTWTRVVQQVYCAGEQETPIYCELARAHTNQRETINEKKKNRNSVEIVSRRKARTNNSNNTILTCFAYNDLFVNELKPIFALTIVIFMNEKKNIYLVRYSHRRTRAHTPTHTATGTHTHTQARRA